MGMLNPKDKFWVSEDPTKLLAVKHGGQLLRCWFSFQRRGVEISANDPVIENKNSPRVGMPLLSMMASYTWTPR